VAGVDRAVAGDPLEDGRHPVGPAQRTHGSFSQS
jgi:hypothetical protein